MVWGSKIDETIIEKYIHILIHLSLHLEKCWDGNGFIFQHGIDPKHTAANTVKACLHRRYSHGLTFPESAPQHY